MDELRRYKKKSTSLITAVQLDLDTQGFRYRKWGGEQSCKRGDWIVDNGGDIYTIDQDTFAKTYQEVSPGHYAKTTIIHAEVATSAGVIETKEGETHFDEGDYLVYNATGRRDGYAVKPEKFRDLYEPAEPDGSE